MKIQKKSFLEINNYLNKDSIEIKKNLWPKVCRANKMIYKTILNIINPRFILGIKREKLIVAQFPLQNKYRIN